MSVSISSTLISARVLFQLHEVALSYYSDCQNDSAASAADILNEYRQHKWQSISSYTQLTEECRFKHHYQYSRSRDGRHFDDVTPVVRRCCVSMVLDGLEPSKYNACDVCVNHFYSKGHAPFVFDSCAPLTLTRHRDTWFRPFDLSLNECLLIRPSYHPHEYVSMCCDNFSLFDFTASASSLTSHWPSSSASFSSSLDSAILSMTPSTTPSDGVPRGRSRTPLQKHSDPFVRAAVKNYRKRKCQKLRRQRLNQWAPSGYDLESLALENATVSVANITGLGCHNNNSLTFLAMDSIHSDMFAQSLGVDLHLGKNDTLLVLVDPAVSVCIILGGAGELGLSSEQIVDTQIRGVLCLCSIPMSFHVLAIISHFVLCQIPPSCQMPQKFMGCVRCHKRCSCVCRMKTTLCLTNLSQRPVLVSSVLMHWGSMIIVPICEYTHIVHTEHIAH